MAQTFTEGVRIPVTRILVNPCIVTQIKIPEKQGFWAMQVGIGERKLKNTSKPLQGHLKKLISNNNFPRHLAEIKFGEEPRKTSNEPFKVGDKITASDVFAVGDKVMITGVSKGKGFAGVVKRYHFRGGSRTHGQSDRERAPGSIGQTTTPGRIFKGKKMGGRMGHNKISVKNLEVISIDAIKNEMSVSGAIPGPSGTLIAITK